MTIDWYPLENYYQHLQDPGRVDVHFDNVTVVYNSQSYVLRDVIALSDTDTDNKADGLTSAVPFISFYPTSVNSPNGMPVTFNPTASASTIVADTDIADIHWTIDGTDAGDGYRLRTTMSVGRHSVSVSAVDSRGAYKTATDTVLVRPETPAVPPWGFPSLVVLLAGAGLHALQRRRAPVSGGLEAVQPRSWPSGRQASSGGA